MSVTERFWKHVVISYDGCWNWDHPNPWNGYGYFCVAGRKKKRSHRLAYEWYVEAIPNGQEICHTCDNPGCVNPLHLFPDTHQGNMSDSQMKGRMNFKRSYRGMAGTSPITPKEVREIRSLCALGLSYRTISSQFKIHQSMVGYIHLRKRWAHIK